MPRRRLALVLLCVAAVLAGCGASGANTTTVVVGQAPTTAPAPTTTRAQPRPQRRRPKPPAPPRAGSGDTVPKALGSAVDDSAAIREGVVVAPLAGGPPHVVGSVGAPHAWSTIKPVIAVAVANARRNGELGEPHALTSSERADIQAAIENSDNEAADALFAELGSPGHANDAIDAVLKQSGGTTPVNRALTRPEFSTYGQTEWPMDEAASFYRALANGCLADPASTKAILDAMGSVTPEGGASWGLPQAGLGDVAMKDGLGPESGLNDYTAEQYGIVGSAASGGYVIGVVAQTDATGAEAESAATDLAVRSANALRGWHAPAGSPACS